MTGVIKNSCMQSCFELVSSSYSVRTKHKFVSSKRVQPFSLEDRRLCSVNTFVILRKLRGTDDRMLAGFRTVFTSKVQGVSNLGIGLGLRPV